MANTFASTSSAGQAVGILKNYYAGPIVTQFNDEIPFYREIEKGKEKWSGLQVVRPLKLRRNPGIGATSDGGVLPVIGAQTTQQATIAAKFNYLRFGFTGPMLKASQGDKGAFASIMEYEMEQGLLDHKSDFNRQLFWDGTGDIATVSANAVGSLTITVTGRESGEDGSKFLDVGQVIDIYSGAVLVASGVTINAISGSTTATLTLSSVVTVSANDIVVRSGAGLSNEVQGILTTLDGGTSTIYGINRSTYPSYQGNVVNAAGGALTLSALKQTANLQRQKGNGKLGALYSDFDTERFYEKLLIADKRYVGKVKGDGTFANKDENYLEYGGVAWVPDKDCPQRVFMLDPKSWKKYVLSELEWADETGSYMIAQVSADSFEVRLRHFANVFCEKPAANAVLRNYISP